ncbi:IS110 family transposase [Micromonospora sp. 4G55]|uniref:IS110 family transposase n=2 Tax=Micromonospora sp. 4G55 TaxID=2806102 RepID=UPI001A61B473|nr:IS110 family transposase [Micromonospora sp. 4G55]MBM0258497.1 IS110 family transposase [Micromonospora sp. 4G55]
MSHPPTTSQDDTSPEAILGVDTHKDVHVAAVVSIHGVLLGSHSFPTTAEGYRTMLDWAAALGRVRQAGVEGTHSYGAALTRHLLSAGIGVIEVNQPDKAHRRRRGKTDAIDAEAAARAVLSGRATAVAKTSDGHVERVRLFKLAKASAIKARTQAINQLKAILVGADPTLRDSLTGLSNPKLVRRCAELDPGQPDTPMSAAAYTLRLLAHWIIELTREADDLNQRITDAINAHTPDLLQRHGVGPDTAAALLLAAGDNPQRLTSEASFAALCGASPIEMSSGKTQRRRLNRGGDRQANSALYIIVIARLRWDVRTRAYIDRRVSEGKTRREAIRCLKRYVARELYELIVQTTSHTSQRSTA